MIIVHEREIPERFADKFSKCCKCGKHPVIKSYFNDVSGDKYAKITCPNDECNIEIDFDRHLSELVDRWNKKNSKDWGELVFYYGDIIKTNDGYYVLGDNEPCGMIAGQVAFHKIRNDEVADYLKSSKKTEKDIIELDKVFKK
ncbi:MAG: hypothetical protein IKP65_04770 [Alphaproteobacteria bacterium]|nr:hypothetical protein [Alphaproteobacteria bacterium]